MEDFCCQASRSAQLALSSAGLSRTVTLTWSAATTIQFATTRATSKLSTWEPRQQTTSTASICFSAEPNTRSRYIYLGAGFTPNSAVDDGLTIVTTNLEIALGKAHLQ